MGKKNILLAIPSFLDPEIPGDKGNFGPILQLLREGSFDEVILFGLQTWRINVFLTEQAIHSQFPNIVVHRSLLPIDNLFVYKDVFAQLKTAFLNHETYLKTQCEEPVVLLPPSSYDCLFDCWLLLTTSLNIKIRLCKIEPHYSLEGIFSQKPIEEGMDWMNENYTDFQDVITDQVAPVIPQLTAVQMAFLTQILAKQENCYLQVDHHLPLNALSQFLLRCTHQQGSNFMKINCEAIPGEISDALLFGYTRALDHKTHIERKGLLQRLKKGWLLLSHTNDLSAQTNQHIVQYYKEHTHCHFLSLITTSQSALSDLPHYILPKA